MPKLLCSPGIFSHTFLVSSASSEDRMENTMVAPDSDVFKSFGKCFSPSLLSHGYKTSQMYKGTSKGAEVEWKDTLDHRNTLGCLFLY